MKATTHGNLIVVNGIGILILGDAGSGKTTVCLELANRGHNFIADDSVVIESIGERLIGTASPIMGGRMNVRGTGICKMPRRSYLHSGCEIALIVEIRGAKCDGESRESFFGVLNGSGERSKVPKYALLRNASLADSIEQLTR